MTDINVRYDSYAEWIDRLRHEQHAWPADHRDAKDTEPNDWNGNVTLNQALLLAEYGWPEGRDLLHNVTTAMVPQNVAVAQYLTTEIDVAGAYPIVPLAVAGEPAHMAYSVMTDRETRIVRCVVTVACSHWVKPESILHQGGAIVSYIDALEKAGWSCEIWARQAVSRGDIKFLCDICVKQAGEILDIDKVAFALVHPAFLRRLMFREMETHRALAPMWPGYGRPEDITPDDAQVFVPRIQEKGTLSENQALKNVGHCMDKALQAEQSASV